jgi:hypothetical protein
MYRLKGGTWQYAFSVTRREFSTLEESVGIVKTADEIGNLDNSTQYRIAKIQRRVPSPEEAAWAQDMKAIKKNYPNWVKILQSTYDEALGTVPPIYFQGGWAMGEAERYNTAENANEYTCFTKSKGKFWACQNTIKNAVATCP